MKVGRHGDPREDARRLISADPLSECAAGTDRYQGPLALGWLRRPAAVEQADRSTRVGGGRSGVGIPPQ